MEFLLKELLCDFKTKIADSIQEIMIVDTKFEYTLQQFKDIESSEVQSLKLELRECNKEILDLKQKLKQYEDSDKKKGDFLELVRYDFINTEKEDMLERISDELNCTICTEIFIDPTSLSCGHTYCKFCIEGWKKECNDNDDGNKEFSCPCCRAKIVREDRNLYLDNLINAIVNETDDNLKKAREELVKKRRGETADETKSSTIKTGTLLSFFSDRGYGFIEQDDEDENLFVHYTAIPSYDEYERVGLVIGQKVEYTVERALDGRLRANNVTGPRGAQLIEDNSVPDFPGLDDTDSD